MKRLVVSIITIISAICFTLGFIGCGAKTINDPVAKKMPPVLDEPYYKSKFYNDGIYDYNWGIYFSDYDDFSDYLNDFYKGKCRDTFYIWTPGECGAHGEDDPYNGEGFRYDFGGEGISIYAEKDKKTGKYKNSKIVQNFSMYSLDWSDKYEESVCVYMTIITAAVDNCYGEPEVRFGEYKDSRVKFPYANVLCGETCVATIIYDISDCDDITLEWVENYIINHLILWSADNER